MVLSAPPLYRGGKPELNFFSYHWWSRYRSCGKRVTDSSQAVIISFVPTSLKSPHYLRPMRARDTAYFESYATDVFITPWLSPCSIEGCYQGENSVALINVAINFVYEYFSFVIYFSKIFFIKTFFWNFIPKFFFQNFFSKFFFQNFFFQNFKKFFFSKLFFKIFFLLLFSKIFFPTSFQNSFFKALLSMLSRLQRQNGLYVSVLWKMIYRPV